MLGDSLYQNSRVLIRVVIMSKSLFLIRAFVFRWIFLGLIWVLHFFLAQGGWLGLRRNFCQIFEQEKSSRSKTTYHIEDNDQIS